MAEKRQILEIPGQPKAGVAIGTDRFRCLLCGDEGIVELANWQDGEWMPCTCKAGDRWRDNPPVCKCGRPAVYCLLSATPLCKVHGTAEAIRGKRL